MNTEFEEENSQGTPTQIKQASHDDLDENEQQDSQTTYPPTNSTKYNKSTENENQSPPQEPDYTDTYKKKKNKNHIHHEHSEDLDASHKDTTHYAQETGNLSQNDSTENKQEEPLGLVLLESGLESKEQVQENFDKRNSAAAQYPFDQNNISLVESKVYRQKESKKSEDPRERNSEIRESEKQKINSPPKEEATSANKIRADQHKNGQKSINTFKESKKPDNIHQEEAPKLQKISRNSSIEDPSKSSIKNLSSQLEGTVSQVSKKETMRISKTIETQTNDIEFPSSYVTGLQSERVDITIPETKIIKDGLIYTYLVYKIVTKLNDDDENNTEFIVYRRYSDFDWLFENLASKYDGYIIPMPPPKNILTAFNKEGVEFAETRKKELVVFLRKCMQHPFLRNTPEINIFLSDDKGFQDFKKKEQNLQPNKPESSLLSNVSKMLNGPTKTNPLVFRELNELESDIHNFEVLFSNLGKRLQLFSTNVIDYLQLKRKQTTTLISFTHDLESLLSDSRSSKLEEAFKKITRANISRIDDEFIKDYSEKIEIHLKDITNNVDAINNSIDRRNYIVKELGALHEKIEEKNLKFKKDANSMNGEEIEDLRKEFERLKKRCQEASEILIKELKLAKQRVDHDLSVFIQNISQRKETYFLEVYNLWDQTSE